MRAPSIKDLPPPPGGKRGWPWTEESRVLPERLPDGTAWPKISIVTPNYNYGQFIEETIRSVLLQGYPNLEYIIMDGGSVDGSVEIIRKYEKYLSFFRSGRDRGQAHAINEGFSHATGDIFAWINSDDFYQKDVFAAAARAFRRSKPDRFWHVMSVNFFTPEVNVSCVKPPHPSHSLADWTVGKAEVNQQGAFWSKAVWERAGGLDASMHLEFDREFFVRLIAGGQRFTTSDDVAAVFRLHAACKSRSRLIGQHEHARISLKYLSPDQPGYAAEKKRLLGTLAYLHGRFAAADRKPLLVRGTEFLKMFYYKLRAKLV